ncbi:MAG: HDOD domain-containing protein [Gammaproteobacteria bacterium]|nr:HDOD domain-containing protein [Gammaproteobacteria bacterium]
MPEIFVGRQPIYNKQLKIYGYELLFRSDGSPANAFQAIGADGATSTTIINSYLEIGLEKLVGNRLAFINLTEQFMLNENSLPISPKQAVLEILEDIVITDEIIEASKRLKSQGFILALDDYIYNPDHKPLMPYIDIVKIDIMQLSEEELVDHVNILKTFDVKLLAEKIETMDEFFLCHRLGFEYFQGYFLSKPRVIKKKTLASNKMAVLNLLSILMNPESDMDEIEEAIGFDVSFSYKMLKLINSALFNLNRKIDSIRQAIVILGRKRLRSWASLLALSSLDDRPSEILHLTMVRAKMCELLSEAAGLQDQESFFTVGLFSGLDILMERELSDLLKPLPLNQDIVNALISHEGDCGEAIQCVMAYEVSDFENNHFKNLTQNDIFVAHIEAVSWANMVFDAS